MIVYRVGMLGRRKLRNRIYNLDEELTTALTKIEHLEEEIETLEGTISSLQSQITQLQSDLQAALDLAQLRANIITYKNNYIHTLQDILDNNGIPYPPEPVYPNS